MSPFAVRPARDDGELRAAMTLRHVVFVDEQGVPEGLEVDEYDATATHLVAVAEEGVIGTCRLVTAGPVVKLGRLAVGAGARRRGVARALLDEAERWARVQRADRIVLSAQTYARGLYLAAGYEERGETYLEAGIEHVRMELTLA